MALLPIITAPDARLKTAGKPVDAVDDEIRQLMDDMMETMYAAPGVGLAAPQVGVLKRVIVADVSRSGESKQPIRMANPEIVNASADLSAFEEGCLSLPDHFAEVKRPETVCVRFLDYENEICEEQIEGFLATCIQHEMDHLDGVLFVDHISKLKRGIIMRKLTKLKTQNAKAGV
jgi:peptide deformylase